MNVKRRHLFWFIILRLAVIISLAVAAVFIQYGTADFLEVSRALFHLYYFVFIVFIVSGIYFLLYWWNRYIKAQIYVQIFVDLIFITYLVYVSGGMRGSFYFLYIFEIIAASIILSNHAAYITAGLSCIFFGGLVDATYFGWIPYFSPGGEKIPLALLLNNTIIAWSVFFLVAFLINYLTGNLRKTREKLARTQKELEIKRHLAMAGEFAAQLAHEIRNPLAAVSGSVQVLEKSLKLPEDQKDLMNIVVEESDRVSQSIEQFLNLASPEKQVFTRVSLTETLRETLMLLERGGELNGNIELEGNYAVNSVHYYGNKNQLKQIFWNILKNGIKAMPQGGKLKIDFYQKEGGGVRAEFSDTGTGMDPQQMDKLFEPFYSGFKHGSGIGMSVVKRIVDEYGGNIAVESELRQGTSVVIDLPEMEAEEETA